MSHRPTPWTTGPSPDRRSVRAGLLFVAIYLATDWSGHIRQVAGLDVTAWNPAPALAVMLLMLNSRWVGVVALAICMAELLFSEAPTTVPMALATSVGLASSHWLLARALTSRIDLQLAFAMRSDVIWMLAMVVVSALLNALIYVSVHLLAGAGSFDMIPTAVLRYWIGDAVGLLVTLPLVLALNDSVRRSDLKATLEHWQWWVIAAVIAVLLWAIIAGFGGQDRFRYFYLLFMPVIWASTQFALSGALLSVALTQVGLLAALLSVPSTDTAVFESQERMAAIAITGLLLGVVVDELHRASLKLRGSLRLAAAGQMAASLAHELSQPLTALSSYAQACRVLVSQLDDAARAPKLAEVIERMVQDAHRASQVVKRLRDFFRHGTTQLQATRPSPVLNEAIDMHQRRASAAGVRLERSVPDDLGPVWMDAVQVAVVLRNLIANALDAAVPMGANGRVVVRARPNESGLIIEVHDNGPGIPADQLQALFESGYSDKPGGMGVGLGICRAIVEAHGGRLMAAPGPGGRFWFNLPAEEPTPATLPSSSHAP